MALANVTITDNLSRHKNHKLVKGIREDIVRFEVNLLTDSSPEVQ